MSRSGTGAPPVTTKRMLDRSAVGQSSDRTRPSRMSGLPNPTLTRCCSISRRIASALTSSGTTIVPPTKRTGRTFTPVPPTRKNGAIAIVTSSLRKSAQVRKLMTFHVTLPWVSITPFGRPVVPEVCGSRHRSSAPTDSSITSSRDSARSVSKSNAPSSESATVPPPARGGHWPIVGPGRPVPHT